MSEAAWRIDLTAWPRNLEIHTGTASGALDWVMPSEAPGGLAELVTVDLDRRGRCVGMEVWDRAALDGRPTGRVQPILPPEPLEGLTQAALEKWLRSVRVIAGPGDPHASVHWSSRRAYDVSAELADPDVDADAWIQLGLAADGRLAAVRLLEPARRVRGLG